MKVTRKIATGVLLGWMSQSALAAQPPGIQRPTPPPCCADGQCLASPTTFGYYDTRWRRWPQEVMAQAVTGKDTAPTPSQQDVNPYETPPAHLEDRKAPPPSVPAGEQPFPPGAGGPQRGPGGPGGPTGQQGMPQQQPPAGGFPLPPQAPSSPAGPSTQPSSGPQYKNVSPDSPLNRSGTSPMGDADPPPSLPFGPTLVSPEQPLRELSQQPMRATAPPRSVKPAAPPSNDPPPAPPIALASFEQY